MQFKWLSVERDSGNRGYQDWFPLETLKEGECLELEEVSIQAPMYQDNSGTSHGLVVVCRRPWHDFGCMVGMDMDIILGRIGTDRLLAAMMGDHAAGPTSSSAVVIPGYITYKQYRTKCFGVSVCWYSMPDYALQDMLIRIVYDVVKPSETEYARLLIANTWLLHGRRMADKKVYD